MFANDTTFRYLPQNIYPTFNTQVTHHHPQKDIFGYGSKHNVNRPTIHPTRYYETRRVLAHTH